ncbi:MAG: ABC transporter permease, partial [Rubrivivax sp.]|nr:ABC transporter permease [Rubrivivax sp.]
MPKFVLLWTDAAIWLLVAALAGYAVMVVRRPQLAANWRKVFHDAPALCSSLILVLCLGVTLLDSVHYRSLLPQAPGAPDADPAYDTRTKSVLDALLQDLLQSREATYSRPLSYLGFTKESLTVAGEIRRVAPRLVFGGSHLKDPETEWAGDIARRAATGLALGAVIAVLLSVSWVVVIARSGKRPLADTWQRIRRREGAVPWLAALVTVWVLCLLA